MTAPNQDPTPWELLRAMQQLRDDLRSDFAELGARLAEMVTKIQYEADRRTDELRIKAIQDELATMGRTWEAEREATRSARRLALTALVAPVIVGVVVAISVSLLGL
ncbi:hypothetical protein TPA0598_04_03160 [Streptomyces lydicamycinicus]|uniref:Uncharacterized protein n=1 Tax=Streptomyces lydicamycinicus TaxID=1546107 RepID=A0A0P4R6W6_9ACTN|nr:hypothetical protein [Streptomyces lydicamycinicus]GAO08680.1 hypothetical protein TPA0598_04_03160 [Streptomyces lydicamycinicus]